jgi:hypothetical protein
MSRRWWLLACAAVLMAGCGSAHSATEVAGVTVVANGGDVTVPETLPPETLTVESTTSPSSAQLPAEPRPPDPTRLVAADRRFAFDDGDVLAVSVPSFSQRLEAHPPRTAGPPTVFVTAAPSNRIAVLDVEIASVEILLLGGDMIRTIPIELPTVDKARMPFGFTVGPDDVVYVFEAHEASNRVAAYGEADGVYRQVAISEPWEVPADGQPIITLGQQGPSFVDRMTEPLMAYVDPDGRESGVTLPIEPIVADYDDASGDLVSRYQRGGTTTRIDFRSTGADVGACAACDVAPGPGNEIIVVRHRDGPFPDDGITIAVIGDDVSRYRFEWGFGGVTDQNNLVLYRLTDNGVEVGVFSLE